MYTDPLALAFTLCFLIAHANTLEPSFLRRAIRDYVNFTLFLISSFASPVHVQLLLLSTYHLSLRSSSCPNHQYFHLYSSHITRPRPATTWCRDLAQTPSFTRSGLTERLEISFMLVSSGRLLVDAVLDLRYLLQS